MSAYYNENDAFAAAWLRELIKHGHLPMGDVDERSIVDVSPDDLRGYRQCHFFAGIGGWPYALNLAGWGDRPVWTGSCPCQPFSSAGRQGGALDERHLWPWWLRLIRQCRPDAILGEQVEGAVGFGWVDRVFADLEAEDYACGAAVLGAHSVGAPHIRQRLFWVADAEHAERGALGGHRDNGRDGANGGWEEAHGEPGARSAVLGFWSAAVWLPCLDGKARRVEPEIQPLASGLSRCLEHMRSIEDEAFAEVIAYGAANQADANEILRMVRDTFRAQSCRQECSTRMCQQFHAQEVLLDLLLCKATACNGAADEGRIAKAREEAKQRVLRSVRIGGGNGCPSCGQQSDEQLARQPADALHLLPFVLARHAQAYWQGAIDAHVASNRVGLLRGSGNSIVPQAAAEFVRAFMDIDL